MSKKAKTMTLKQARTLCRALGFSLRSKSEWSEYRLCAYGAPEAQAYYTDDLEDAVGTCKQQANVAAGPLWNQA